MAGILLSLCDLCEAEGRVLRLNVARTGKGCGLYAVGLLFLAAAPGYIVYAIYASLLAVLPKPVCLLIVAFFCMALAIAFLWSGQQCLKKKPMTRSKRQ